LRTGALAIGGWVALVFVSSALAQEGGRDRAISLPAGAGQKTVIESCVQCHDLRAVVSQRKSQQAWKRTVDEMVWRGAMLLPGEAAEVARYLASAFGTDAPARPRTAPSPAATADDPARLLPAGAGRALVARACVQCHGLQTTVQAKLTPQEWHRMVDLMVRLGARLEGNEPQVVADYLAGAFGTAAP